MTNDVIFIQFYSNLQNTDLSPKFYVGQEYTKLDLNKFGQLTILCNGFSSIFEQCKKHGKFHWVEYNLSTDINQLNKNDSKANLPIVRGTAYVSAFFNCHLYQSYLWAKRYPEIKFIVGGPAADKDKVKEELPNNLEITNESVDKIFKGQSKWGIELPENIHNEVLLGFPIDRNCYWGKCTFCNYSKKFDEINIDYNFIDTLPIKRKYHIFLYTPSISPSFLRDNVSRFKVRKDIEYAYFIRGGRESFSSLKIAQEKIKTSWGDLSKLTQVIGFEFPANRILKKFNKGVTTEDLLKSAELMALNGSRIYPQVLLGINDLTEQDVSEAKIFFEKFYDIVKGRAKIKIHSFVCKVNTPIIRDYKIKSKFNLGPFYLGFLPELSPEQQKLNDRVRDIIYETKFYQILDVYSSDELKVHEFL